MTVMPTLPHLAGDLCFFASSPALPLWYINLPLFTSTINIEYLVKNKTDSLRFSPFLAQNLNFSYSQYGFWGIFALTKIISSIRILIVCTSCEMSYNVLGNSHLGLGQFFGGGGSKKETVSRF